MMLKSFIYTVLSSVIVILHNHHMILASTESDDVQKLCEDFFLFQCQLSPYYASKYCGDEYKDDGFFEYTLENYQRIYDKTVEFYQRASELRPDTESDSISLNVVKAMMKTLMDGYKYVNYAPLNPISSLDGPQVHYPKIVDSQRNYTVEQLDTMLVKFRNFPKHVDNLIVLMKRSVELGRTHHNYSMQGVLEDFKKLIDPAPEEHQFFAPFNKSHVYEDDDQRDRYQSVAVGHIVKYIIPAYEKMTKYLKEDYLLNTRDFIGASSMKNGDEYYSTLIKFYLGQVKTPEEIHKLGLQEVNRIENKMKELKEQLNYHGTLKEFLENVKKDSRFLLKTGDELLDYVKEIVFDRINPSIRRAFKNFPEYELEVRPTPTDGILGYYNPPSADGDIPAIYYLNTHRVKDTPTFGMLTLSLHEASPGHHFQIATSMAQKDIPAVRRNGAAGGGWFMAPFDYPWFEAYGEGWALYAEELGFELGLYDDPFERLGYYSSEMFEACRLVVDTGIHAFNWTRAQAIEFMGSRIADPIEDVEKEIDRYITWPGQALAYKIGSIKIRALRTAAERELGHKFDVREFHDTVLCAGSVPLNILEEIVGTWVEKEKRLKCVPPDCAPGDKGGAAIINNVFYTYVVALNLFLLGILLLLQK